MYIVNLIRERASEGNIWVDIFLADDSVTDPLLALRTAVSDFLKTDAGKEAAKHCCYDFNWGDAVAYIPDEFWSKYGLRLDYTPKVIDVRVNQDEVLCGDDVEGEE